MSLVLISAVTEAELRPERSVTHVSGLEPRKNGVRFKQSLLRKMGLSTEIRTLSNPCFKSLRK